MFAFLLRVFWVAYHVLVCLVCWLLPLRTREEVAARWNTQGSFPEPRPTQAFSLSHLRPIFSSSELAQPGMLPSHCVLLVCVQERECACMCLRVCIYTYKCMHCERVYVYMCLCMWKLSVYGAESYTPPAARTAMITLFSPHGSHLNLASGKPLTK